MLHTQRSMRGMVVAPHHLASQAGLRILWEGGNAIEALIAACATIAVVYPHMNGIGGDNFWLIRKGAGDPVGIDACGGAAQAANPDLYREAGLDAIPARGPLAAITVAGAVSGWNLAAQLSRKLGGKMPLSRLLEDAVHYARHGVPITRSQHDTTQDKKEELKPIPGFADVYLPEGRVPEVGQLFRQPALADTLEQLCTAGLQDFYTGDLARTIATGLANADSPLRAEDFGSYEAKPVEPLHLATHGASVYNLPPPTQGIASLIILGLFERLGCDQPEQFEFVHGLVEATKQAFRVRDAHITDPDYMTVSPDDFLTAKFLADASGRIDHHRASLWNGCGKETDTVWLGAIDAEGTAVSCIQSLYWEFGSGLVLPETGITWQNRGTSFSLSPNERHLLSPGRKPFHTIQPPLAVFDDGRVMVYGTMGGEGQPQTQAAIFTRYAAYGQELQKALTAPRWLLGRTWGEKKTNLRVEDRFSSEVLAALEKVGHDIELVGPFDAVMGHAGAIVRYPSGLFEGAADPRGDGCVAAF